MRMTKRKREHQIFWAMKGREARVVMKPIWSLRIDSIFNQHQSYLGLSLNGLYIPLIRLVLSLYSGIPLVQQTYELMMIKSQFLNFTGDITKMYSCIVIIYVLAIRMD